MYYVEDYCVVNKGIVPETNEDNIFINGFNLVQDNNGINNYTKEKRISNGSLCYGVFDGIGGLDNGEYASYLATSLLSTLFDKYNIKKLLLFINKKIININKEENINMGTTASIVKINRNIATLSLVGDSVIYVLSRGKFTKYIQNEHKDLLDNYLGKNDIRIMQEKITLKHNDKIIICSDGLTKLVGDLDIEYVLNSSDDIIYITNKLLNDALLNGGKDNISIITLLVQKDYKEYIYIGLILLLIVALILFLWI